KSLKEMMGACNVDTSHAKMDRAGRGPFSLSKKSGYAGHFRQMLKKCLRPGAQTPRPPGKAGRYEFTLEGDGGKRVPCGHLPPKVAKRPEGVNRNERWARPAPAATIEVAELRTLQTTRKGFVNGLNGPRRA